MKIACFDWQGGRHLGRVNDEQLTVQRFDVDLAADDGDGVVHLMRNQIDINRLSLTDTVALSEITLQSPVPRPNRNIFCVGKNYHDHAREFAASGFDSSAAKGDIPSAPIVFSKLPETVIATDEAIQIDRSVSIAVDYEVELAVIIGKSGKNIAREQAMSHVWGYTIVNDVTARDLQGHHSQWLIGKSQNTFCPMGPWATTADSLDLNDCRVQLWVNDELRQDSNTALLIFDVPEIIRATSNGITLLPGDVIATGTPAGVGIGFDPPRYLVSGDRVRLEIAGVGSLMNPVEAI